MLLTNKVLSDVAHGFFGRKGGVSTGMYESLNCGLGTNDAIEAIRENRRRVALKMGARPEQLLTLWQHHSSECITVTQPWPMDVTQNLPKMDAMATNRPGLVLGILTADCAPVLFRGTDKNGHPVVGIAHAGWKGALGGIIENTVTAMKKLGAGNIAAVIGPCIRQESYEVSADFMTPFLERDKDAAGYFAAGKSESVRQFDLPGYVLRRLRLAGIGQVSNAKTDTYAQEEDYFSYRRSTHRNEADYGRQISIISIRP